MKTSIAPFRYLLIFIFGFLSLNRIVGGYGHMLAGFFPGFDSPLYSPWGQLGALGISPLPRAYTGLGFSDKIEIYVQAGPETYLIDLDFHKVDQLAHGHLYKYDVYLHSFFWPMKAPDILDHAHQILKFLICQDKDFRKLNGITSPPGIALIVRTNLVTQKPVWHQEIVCAH